MLPIIIICDTAPWGKVVCLRVLLARERSQEATGLCAILLAFLMVSHKDLYRCSQMVMRAEISGSYGSKPVLP